jgi:hypothetical protein
VVAGLNSDRDTQLVVGVAIYRFALTAGEDWDTYDRLWLGRYRRARSTTELRSIVHTLASLNVSGGTDPASAGYPGIALRLAGDARPIGVV